jgi:mono/diheme cytochrome c family protein
MPESACPSRRSPRLRLALLVLALLPAVAHAAPDHPIIPSFERFFRDAKADTVRGGRLLLGELNCMSCHQPEGAALTSLARKQAPVLDDVAGRVRRGYLRKFLADPAGVKPGTTMPDVLAGLPQADRKQKVEELTHFLASTGVLRQDRSDRKLIGQGQALYHRVGCVACHGSRTPAGDQDKTALTSVPLGDLKAKYSSAGLAGFLRDPHQARPSGRMPGLLLHEPEARAIANYLLQGTAGTTDVANLAYTYYEGSWENLPDFDKLQPVAQGQVSGFDLSVALRNDNMAVRFEGYLRIERDGEYRFHLSSDDGSKLWIDGKTVADNDGTHAPRSITGKARLRKGVHKFVAAVFNAGGGVELGVDIEGPGLTAQPVAPFVFLTPQGNPAKKPHADTQNDDDLEINTALAGKGRQAFSSLGCAACHQLAAGGKKLESKVTAPPLAKLKGEGGCLAANPARGLPRYGLSDEQRIALAEALKTPIVADKPTPQEVLTRTLITFNCYACHQRDKVSGMEEVWNTFFVTTQPEMGDEGRVPPSLDGVGAKIATGWLNKIFADGSKDRPYMHTRMPKFGAANVGHLTAVFEALDKVESMPRPHYTQTSGQIKAAARQMVGGTSLGCIKCHLFAGHKAEGVQGIDMVLMPQRLKRDWFHRYVRDPEKFRPGTRMPSAWPKGESLLPAILDGDANKQIEAVWVYLSDGGRAQLPIGLGPQFIALVPEKEAIIYRNFIEGAGPRGIAVGYPEKAHLAFDANDLRLALLWQGDFIDAARHWTDRGAGFQGPLGDNVLRLSAGPDFAVLPSEKAPWPNKHGKELGFRFRGYRLTPDDRPTFRYSIGGVEVEDFPNAIPGKPGASIRRTLTLSAAEPVSGLYFRAAVGDRIEDIGDGWYRINGEWKMRVQADGPVRVRDASGKKELLVGVSFRDGKARIVQEFVW